MQVTTYPLDWQDSVAIYKRLYTTDTVSSVTPDLVAGWQAAARLTRLSGIPINLPDPSSEKLTDQQLSRISQLSGG